MKRLFTMLCLASLVASTPAGPAVAMWPFHGPMHDRPKPPHGPHKGWAAFLRPGPPERPKVVREIQSELCATTARAEVDARRALEATVRDWLAEDGVAPTWTPPKRLVDRMIVGTVTLEPVTVKDLSVFRATISADFSRDRKREFLEVYGRQVAGRRLAILGGILLIVLSCLAAISGYIRADEATKGYFTNRLRVLAAAGVGAAGFVVYQILT